MSFNPNAAAESTACCVHADCERNWLVFCPRASAAAQAEMEERMLAFRIPASTWVAEIVAGFLDPKSATWLSLVSKFHHARLRGQFAPHGICTICNVRLLVTPGRTQKFSEWPRSRLLMGMNVPYDRPRSPSRKPAWACWDRDPAAVLLPQGLESVGSTFDGSAFVGGTLALTASTVPKYRCYHIHEFRSTANWHMMTEKKMPLPSLAMPSRTCAPPAQPISRYFFGPAKDGQLQDALVPVSVPTPVAAPVSTSAFWQCAVCTGASVMAAVCEPPKCTKCFLQEVRICERCSQEKQTVATCFACTTRPHVCLSKCNNGCVPRASVPRTSKTP